MGGDERTIDLYTTMTVGLFIPCYIDQFFPQVGIATLQLLDKLGLNVEYPVSQTCCGQPMANSGFEQSSVSVYQLFVKNFSMYDYVVTPTGSCAYHIRKHFNKIDQTPEVVKVRSSTFELVSFLTEVLKMTEIAVSFPYQVGLHQSCHGQRGLGLSNASEVTPDQDGQAIRLLRTIKDIKLTQLTRPDECCGFGGTFCVSEEAVSARMGIDRIADHVRNKTEVLTGGDMSCLMHLDGIIKRQRLPIKVMHIAEILNGNNI